MLTRAGAFRLDSNLNLVNPDGYQVLDTAGNPIKFLDDGVAANNNTNFSKITSIDPSGLITYLAKDGITTNYYNATGAVGVAANAANAATVQRLAVVTVTNPGGLDKAGGTLFRPTAASGVSSGAFTLAANKANGSSEKIYTNSLEQSNVDMAGQFVKMILTQRAYSANSKTITTADEMTQEVLNLKR
jgi:flagellar hook protein FlgE